MSLTKSEQEEILKIIESTYDMENKIERMREKSATSIKSTIHSVHKINRERSYLVRLEGKLLGMKKEIKKLTKSNSKQDKKRLDELEVEYKYNQDLYKQQEKRLKAQKQSISYKSTLYAIGNSTYSLLEKSLKSYVKQDKAVKNTALSMGLVNSQMKSMRKTMYQTSQQTRLIGVGVEDLAKMQNMYSEGIGRAVILSESQLEAVSLIAKGTMLGAEGAGNLLSAMDLFGVGAEKSKKIIEDIVNDSHKMGVNSNNVIKKMSGYLKKAQGYKFKNGIKGITQMAIRAEKFKLSFESATTMASKLINPEGAIDMAANLQVLGGKWAQLGDTFDLMFKARHDVDGLHKSIIEATKGTAQWDKALGLATITGNEMQRLQEVAKATGIDYAELAEASRSFARQSAMTKELKFSIGDKNKDFITSLATWDDEKKAFTVDLGDGKGTQLIKNLSNDTLKMAREKTETLNERAKFSQTFDETWNNIVSSLKSTALPLLESIADGIQEPLMAFVNYLQGDDGKKILAGLTSVAKAAGGLISSFGEWIGENPLVNGLKTAAGAMAIGLAGKAVQWIYNGKMLAVGFNMGVKGGSGGPGGSKGKSEPLKNMNRRQQKRLNKQGINQGSNGQYYQKGKRGAVSNADVNKASRSRWNRGGSRGGSRGGKMGRMGGVGLGAVAALGGMGLDMYRNSMDDPDSTAGKWAGVGSSALEWGGTGAMVGSMFGPLGTLIGAGVGAIGGGLYGAYNEGMFDSELNQPVRDAILSKDGITPIDKNDDLVAYKPGGPVDNKINGNTSSEITVKPITINGTIKLETGTGFNHNLLDDPIFKRELAKVIGEEISKNTYGGKYNNK